MPTKQASSRTLLDGHARLNGSVFYYDYKNYQAFLFVGVGGVVINADADNVGAEMDLQISTHQGPGCDSGAARGSMRVVKDIPLRFGSPLPPRDLKPTYAPPVQATAMVRYRVGGTVGNPARACQRALFRQFLL